jgi:hypothetical protein
MDAPLFFCINTSDTAKKNRIVKAFGRKLASDEDFHEFIKFASGSHHLIIEKNRREKYFRNINSLKLW